jgi:hypothetical protein
MSSWTSRPLTTETGVWSQIGPLDLPGGQICSHFSHTPPALHTHSFMHYQRWKISAIESVVKLRTLAREACVTLTGKSLYRSRYEPETPTIAQSLRHNMRSMQHTAVTQYTTKKTSEQFRTRPCVTAGRQCTEERTWEMKPTGMWHRFDR